MTHKIYKTVIKPTLDFLVAFIGLLVLSPIFLFVMISLAIANNGKPFFFQKRPGKNEKIFSIIKFKTMNDKKDDHGELLPMGQRITKIGGFIRKTSLDELPQLINVLKGDMSLIGPRPLLIEYLPMYTTRQKKRHLIKPGITGWAQVNGRNLVSWKEKFEMDVWYVENFSMKLDFTILVKTVLKIVLKQDVADTEPKVEQKDFSN